MPIIGDGEPDVTREEAVRACLPALFHGAARQRINSAEPSETGLCLDDRFVSLLEINRLLASPPLTRRQVRILALYYGADLTNEEVGGRLGIDATTVVREKRAAVQTMIRILWDEPGYVTPRRSWKERLTGAITGVLRAAPPDTP